MNRGKDLKGQRFGRLIVTGFGGRDNQSRYRWECKCDCGNLTCVDSRHLIQGNIRSCGCLSKETSRENGKRSGYKLKGPNSHLYNPNLTNEQRAEKRNEIKLREWRKGIFEIDNYTCQICKVRGDSLVAHHLDGWAWFIERRFDLSNGITLCRKCHKEFHDWNGGERKKCTEKDFWEYYFMMVEEWKNECY